MYANLPAKKVARQQKSFAKRKPDISERHLSVHEKDLFMKAKVKELQSFFENGIWTFESTREADPARTLSSRMLLKWSKNPDGSPRAKARLIVRGYADGDALEGNLNMAAPTTSRLSRSFLLSTAAILQWGVWTADVQTAFLQGTPQQRELWVQYLQSPCGSLVPVLKPGWSSSSRYTANWMLHVSGTLRQSGDWNPWDAANTTWTLAASCSTRPTTRTALAMDLLQITCWVLKSCAASSACTWMTCLVLAVKTQQHIAESELNSVKCSTFVNGRPTRNWPIVVPLFNEKILHGWSTTIHTFPRWSQLPWPSVDLKLNYLLLKFLDYVDFWDPSNGLLCKANHTFAAQPRWLPGKWATLWCITSLRLTSCCSLPRTTKMLSFATATFALPTSWGWLECLMPPLPSGAMDPLKEVFFWCWYPLQLLKEWSLSTTWWIGGVSSCRE